VKQNAAVAGDTTRRDSVGEEVRIAGNTLEVLHCGADTDTCHQAEYAE
jgi:hypothetical protein